MSRSKAKRESNHAGGSFSHKYQIDSRRLLRFESLENRRMLAVFTVSLLTDAPVVSAGDAPGTLRQALFDANSTGGADTVNFQSGLTGTITLTQGELTINDAVSIVGPSADQLAIDASGNDLVSPGIKDGSGSRVLNIDDGNIGIAIPVEISGLTLTGGDVSGNGGGIRSLENLTLTGVVIDDNSAFGENTRGGGIYSYGGDLLIDRSTISGNLVSGSQAEGGGVFNTTKLSGAQSTLITNSTISGNQSSGNGGGIFSGNNLLENQTTNIVNSTVSGNTAAGDGGGVFNFDGTMFLDRVTIANNSAAPDSGSGLASSGNVGTSTEVHSSIISGNSGSDVAVVSGDENTLQSTGFNVIGTGNSFGATNQFSALDNFNSTGDQTGVLDPGLMALADNGGLTRTHALTPTSPALDAGDPASEANMGGVPEFDQRLAPFGRVRDGDGDGVARIDVGAFELAASSADFDADGDVDGSDFLAWQRGFGTTSGASRADGDADGNQSVDGADLVVWESTFGAQAAPLSAQQSSQVAQPLKSSNDVESSILQETLRNVTGLSASRGTLDLLEPRVVGTKINQTFSGHVAVGGELIDFAEKLWTRVGQPSYEVIATGVAEERGTIPAVAGSEVVGVLFDRLTSAELRFSDSGF